MKRLLLVLLLLVPLAAVPARAETPVKVTADTLEVDDAAHRATFTGNVVVERKGLRVTADKVVVEYGPGGVSDIRSFTATGVVRVTTDTQTATGQVAVYSPETQILRMTGNVRFEGPASSVTGPELVVDLKTNNTVFTGGSGGRVTGVFTPQ